MVYSNDVFNATSIETNIRLNDISKCRNGEILYTSAVGVSYQCTATLVPCAQETDRREGLALTNNWLYNSQSRRITTKSTLMD